MSLFTLIALGWAVGSLVLLSAILGSFQAGIKELRQIRFVLERINERAANQYARGHLFRLVLVVEDDVSVRRPLVKFLEMHGFSVLTAETADEGLEALRNNPPVAAVVDLRLRCGSGRDFVMSTPDDVPVIIFSGVPSESAELERLRPRTRVIGKPYSLALLVETLEEMLAAD